MVAVKQTKKINLKSNIKLNGEDARASPGLQSPFTDF